MSPNVKAEVISWFKTIAYAVIFAFCINNFIIVNASVPTGSMRNTIMEGDRIVAFRLAYLFSEPDRFEVVVFKYPDNESIYYVKRIIGLPGETVTIIEGEVYIGDSDVPLDTSFLPEKMYGNFGPYVVPEGTYFMLGDNRNNSQDSRYWNNTYLEKDAMLGKVMFRYFPSFRAIR